MVCIGKNIANCSKIPQFLAVICAVRALRKDAPMCRQTPEKRHFSSLHFFFSTFHFIPLVIRPLYLGGGGGCHQS